MEKIELPDPCKDAWPIIIDGEEFVVGRVVITPNGSEPEQEVNDKD